MKIRLRNKFLEIRVLVSISKIPNILKLKGELGEFFDKNKVGGYKIKKFNLVEAPNEIDYRIVPLEPCLDECLSGEDDCEKKIEEIGKKYGVRNLGFVYWCYHK